MPKGVLVTQRGALHIVISSQYSESDVTAPPTLRLAMLRFFRSFHLLFRRSAR